jgi:membrane-associated phospholipid phosphatase
MSGTRKVLFSATAVVYAVIVAAVLRTTELVRWDWQLMLFRPYKQWPEYHAFLDYFVVLGQRGPTAVLVAAWLGWRSWRQRTLRPLLVLATALLLLNASVGAVKIGLGRLGPHYATEVGSAELFAGGDIFPSGHTANAVVTWGILAYLATTPRARRVLSVVAAVFALGVGATTVYLGTHWVSDVLLGWVAGLIILLGLPWCEPLIARLEAKVYVYRERLHPLGGTRTLPAPPNAPTTGAPVAARRNDEEQHPGPHGDTVTASSGRNSAVRGHTTGRAHPARGEHAPSPGTGHRTPTAPMGPRGR